MRTDTPTPQDKEQELRAQVQDILLSHSLNAPGGYELLKQLKLEPLSTAQANRAVRALITAHTALAVKEASDRSYKQGWDSAGGELLDQERETAVAVVEARIETIRTLRRKMEQSMYDVGVGAWTVLHNEEEALQHDLESKATLSPERNGKESDHA